MAEPIAFRLDREADEAFRRKAQERGLGANAFAKELALENLGEGTQVQQLRERILSLESGVQELRRDIGLCVCVLLVATKTMPEDQAKDWVKKNLLH
jgi:hypothetical protein